MANGKSDRKKLVKVLITIIIIAIILTFGIEATSIIQNRSVNSTKQESYTDEDELIVHMIDVGQAESFLLMQGTQTALIDCGKVTTGRVVVKRLKELGITKIDYLIGTHPHEDHIGGMYQVLANFDVGTIILPEVDYGTIVYKILKHKIQGGDYLIKYAKQGDIYNIEKATMEVIATETSPEENINNCSIVFKVSFGEMDIILTGDVEKKIEEKIIESGADIDAEILKVGHHGSYTSSSEEFLDAVNPDYALISCKLRNKYGHPAKSTMERLEERNIEVYRTDECSSVIMTITPNDVSFSNEPGDYLSGTELKEINSIWRVIFELVR